MRLAPISRTVPGRATVRIRRGLRYPRAERNSSAQTCTSLHEPTLGAWTTSAPSTRSGWRAFVWRVAGRSHAAPAGWKRARPLMIVLDTDAVHKRQTVVAAQLDVVAADVQLVYLPSYCPDLSAMEPVWNDVKQHQLPTRSFARLADLKHALDDALARTTQQLRRAYGKSTNVQRLAA